MDGDQIRQVPVLDENGKPVLVLMALQLCAMLLSWQMKPHHGADERDPALKLPCSRVYQEQYARIPLRDDTVDEHAQDIFMTSLPPDA